MNLKIKLKTKESFLLSKAACYFVKHGKKPTANKLFNTALKNYIFANKPATAKKAKMSLSQLISSRWSKLKTGLRKARPQLEFTLSYIKRRLRRVPKALPVKFQRRRVWSKLASLVRRSRQNTKQTLFNEILLIAAGSLKSKVLLQPILIYKKAEANRGWIRKARLPRYPFIEIIKALPLPKRAKKEKYSDYSKRMEPFKKVQRQFFRQKRAAEYLKRKRTLRVFRVFSRRMFNFQQKLYYHKDYRKLFARLYFTSIKYENYDN